MPSIFPGLFSCWAFENMGDTPGSYPRQALSARERAKQGAGHPAGAPVTFGGRDLDTDQRSRVIAFSDRFYPGNGIGDGVIKAAVLRVELPMGLTAGIDQAVKTL